jgi:glycosyltransferase involved in cell wall biosynthesis
MGAEPKVAVDISVIIPALNEEATVGIVVRELRMTGPYEVIVADNGSTDRTAQVAAAAGARVISEPRRGYGAACLAGSQTANGKALVFMDADGSFSAGEVAALAAPILDGQAELVLGARLLSADAEEAILPHQRFGNWLAVRLLRLFSGLQVTDLGPFRAIHRDVLAHLQMSEMTYGWPVEMMVKAQRLRCRILEVPVSCRPRLAGRSKVSGTIKGSVLAGYHIMRVIIVRGLFPGRREVSSWRDETMPDVR